MRLGDFGTAHATGSIAGGMAGGMAGAVGRPSLALRDLRRRSIEGTMGQVRGRHRGQEGGHEGGNEGGNGGGQEGGGRLHINHINHPFVAPESADRHHPRYSPASDMWCVGSVLFHMLVGGAAFPSDVQELSTSKESL